MNNNASSPNVQAPEVSVKPAEPKIVRNFKVLVLDDDPDVCKFISIILSEIGVDVCTINDSKLLNKTLLEVNPDLLLLDILLPENIGFDLLKKLRSDIIYKNLMIVMMTTKQTPNVLLNASAGDADELLYKPLNREELQKCIMDLATKRPRMSFSPSQTTSGVLGLKEASFSPDSVVLIDTNDTLLMVLKSAFESHHLNVKIFQSGDQAIKELITHNSQLPVLIISERHLPDMDGLEILKNLHKKFNSSIPFYFLTSVNEEKDIREGLNQGALEYIVKPFNLALLMKKALKTIANPNT